MITPRWQKIICLMIGLFIWFPGQSQPSQLPDPNQLWLRSHAAIIVDRDSGNTLYEKHADQALPIASLTKLMTAIVILEGQLDMNKIITIRKEDKDTLRYSRSRLPVGTRLSRRDLLKMALIASENRAAAALARTWPGGAEDFILNMNKKARALGMSRTVFHDSTGLHQDNRASARDLTRLVGAALSFEPIQALTSQGQDSVSLLPGNRKLAITNTNRLVRRPHWQINLSKTGYIKESGRCLTMQTTIAGQELIVVLLNAQGRLSSFGDSGRIRKWLEQHSAQQIQAHHQTNTQAEG